MFSNRLCHFSQFQLMSSNSSNIYCCYIGGFYVNFSHLSSETPENVVFAIDSIISPGTVRFIGKLLKSDPWLALNMYFGPLTPYHFRVMGHGTWAGARRAILTTWQRFERPFRTRQVPQESGCCCCASSWTVVALALVFLAIIVTWLL